MKYGLDIPTTGQYADPRKLADLAREAEEAGWDGFFVWDAMLSDEPILDPWIALAAIAMQTQRLSIGAFMTALPRRRPWKVARETVTLDHLSNGRLIFGAGLGFQELDFTAFGEEANAKVRAEKLDEGLAILVGLWTGEPFRFDGKHYQITDVRCLPRPIQSPRIPIWIAGGWPHHQPFRRAAHWDGTYLMVRHQTTGERLTPQHMNEVVAYLKIHCQHFTAFDVAVPGETPSNAQRGMKIVQPYAEAGATWWIEYEASRHGFEEYRERIRNGPPKI